MPQHPNSRKRHLVCLSGGISRSPSPQLLSHSLAVLSNRATMMTFSPNRHPLGGGIGGQWAKYSFSDIKPVTINSLEKKSIFFWAWTGHTGRRMNKAAKTGSRRKAKMGFRTKSRCAGQAAGFKLKPLHPSKFSVHVLLKPGLENFEHYFTSLWDECNCAVVWAFFGIAFLRDWNENWLFPVLWPLLSFPNLLAYWVQHFHSIIFQDLK